MRLGAFETSLTKNRKRSYRNKNTMPTASAPTENEVNVQLPEALEAPIFEVGEW